jgi:hypothetical protein
MSAAVTSSQGDGGAGLYPLCAMMLKTSADKEQDVSWLLGGVTCPLLGPHNVILKR